MNLFLDWLFWLIGLSRQKEPVKAPSTFVLDGVAYPLTCKMAIEDFSLQQIKRGFDDIVSSEFRMYQTSPVNVADMYKRSYLYHLQMSPIVQLFNNEVQTEFQKEINSVSTCSDFVRVEEKLLQLVQTLPDEYVVSAKARFLKHIYEYFDDVDKKTLAKTSQKYPLWWIYSMFQKNTSVMTDMEWVKSYNEKLKR